MKNKIMLLLFLTSQILADWGPEGYVPDNSINWDQLVPLIQALIFLGGAMGFPVIATAIIYIIVKILQYGFNWCGKLAGDITSKGDIYFCIVCGNKVVDEKDEFLAYEDDGKIYASSYCSKCNGRLLLTE
jgi:hypothetical protein